jgi:sortase (surface protein transpeptidase)
METHRQQEAVSTFRQEASTVSADRARELEQEARAWNEARRHGQPLSRDYDQILDITQTGIMATLSIPKISVNLPVYHRGRGALRRGRSCGIQ